MLWAKAFREAEPLLRECLTLSGTIGGPNDWDTINIKFLLGSALLGQKKYAEAEPLLLAGYQGMKQRETDVRFQYSLTVTEALERLVQLNEALEKKDEAAKWRKELEARKESLERLKLDTPRRETSFGTE